MNLWIIPHVPILGLTFLIACHSSVAIAKATQPQPGAAHSGGNVTAKGAAHVRACEPLLLPACKALNMYTSTLLPNSLGHSSQHEVSRAFKRFAPMLKTPGCGDWLSVLLCLTYAPPCPIEQLPRGSVRDVVVAPACRQLCASAWAGCWSGMEKAGLHWPHALDCERMPIGAEEDGRECVMRRGKIVVHTDIPELPSPTKLTRTVKTPALAKDKTPSPKSNSTKKPQTTSQKPKAPIKTTIKTTPSKLKISKPKKKSQSPETKTRPEVKVAAHSSATTGKQVYASNVNKQMTLIQRVKPRRYDVTEVGEAHLFRGWADVQGQGAANDYCRIIGRSPKHRFLACALAGGSGQDHTYVSKRGFDVGHSGTWFMRDMDKDGRDDYCRCVGSGLSSRVACMKAGKHGFYGSLTQPGNQFTFYVKARSSCFGKTTNPLLGVSSKF